MVTTLKKCPELFNFRQGEKKLEHLCLDFVIYWKEFAFVRRGMTFVTL
jgi:hypothetical protein